MKVITLLLLAATLYAAEVKKPEVKAPVIADIPMDKQKEAWKASSIFYSAQAEENRASADYVQAKSVREKSEAVLNQILNELCPKDQVWKQDQKTKELRCEIAPVAPAHPPTAPPVAPDPKPEVKK